MDRLTTTSLSPGRPSFWTLIALIIVFAALLVLATDVMGSETPLTGDWEIDDLVIYSNHDILVNGNITVRDGGELQLYRMNLDMNLSTHGQYHITVETGGKLVLGDVTLDSLDGSSRFNFTIYGIANIGGCTIRRMDGPPMPSPLSNPQGLVIQSSFVQLHNSTISDCGGFAITVEPDGINDVSPRIENCNIEGNGGGIYCGGVLIAKGNARIRGCSFSGNGLGDILVIASDPTITDCTFANSFLSWGLSGVTVAGLAAPTIERCEFSWYFAALNSVFADPTIRDCTITASLAGVTVVGDDPLFDRVAITNCVAPMNLSSTFATVNDCSISGFSVLGYAVEIDAGKPIINRLDLDLTLMGGGIHISNDSRAVLRDSVLSGSGILPVVAVEDSKPTLEGCIIEGGSDGIELVWSPAIIDGCTIRRNSGWGVVSWFRDFVNRGNAFGAGGSVNLGGRVIQLYSLEVWVEHEDGRPAVDATVSLTDAQDDLVDEVATVASGLAFDGVYVEYEVTNANRTITYAPYLAEATLGELFNSTSIEISDNPNVTLVLRPAIDLPTEMEILSPEDGEDLDVWEWGNRIPFEGFVVDPEDGEVTWAWYLDGELVNDEHLEFEMELLPGSYEVALKGMDDGGQSTWVFHNFSVVSIPPEDNFIEILSPEEGDEFDMGETVTLGCEYYVLDHPELEAPVDLPVRWVSDLDGLLLEMMEGEISDLTPGFHVITVSVEPRFPQFIPEPYTASVTVHILPPEPVAFANISSPTDGAEFRWDATVHLAANGSTIDIWDPPEHRVIYRWSSDIDGLLGEGKELDARHLVAGTHTITLLMTTDPFLVSSGATVTINVHPEPNNPPVARITVLTTAPKAGEPVLMTATLSADPDGDLLTYSWDLGDGNSSTSVEVNHTYEAGGNYTVQLTVFDGGLEGFETLVIGVAPADDPGGGGNGGGGNGEDGDGDDGTVEVSDTWLGWLLIVFLFTALGALLFQWYRGMSREG